MYPTRKKQLADQRKLEITLHGLQIKYNTHPSDVLLAEIETVKTSLEAILTNKAEKYVLLDSGCTNPLTNLTNI